MQTSWWQDAIVYQIYPRSFMDSNGDGIGDLRGIRQKLDYLQSLGVDALWLSPIYASPNDDMGYDIADYQAIMTEFGTMADFDALLADVHSRDMRLVMDLVVNHTSDEHAWFQESRLSKESPKRDWYIWRPARPDGGPPNNWRSCFSGSAWEWDDATGEYYLHLFSRKQPDLNWRNAEVRDAVYTMMRSWLDKGVDGFRMDVINMIGKAPGLPDAPVPDGASPGTRVGPGALTSNRPDVHDHLREMYTRVLRHYDTVTVGECHGVTEKTALLYTDPDRRELDMVFQFDHKHHFSQREPRTALECVQKWFDACRGRSWNSAVLGNHDGGRSVSEAGDAREHRAASAKLLNTMLLSLPGTPFVYQGEELAMASTVLDRIEDYRDVETLNRYRERIDEGMSAADALAEAQAASRDRSRTPMQWTSGPQAGFTTGMPWLPVNSDCAEWNAADQESDPDSVLNAFRRLAQWRKSTPEFVHADFSLLDTGSDTALAYQRRTADGSLYLIVLNFSGSVQSCGVGEAFGHEWEFVYGTASAALHGEAPFALAPWEARILLAQD